MNAESFVEERRRLGIDRQDERWEGEWHVVNPPKRWHVRLNADLFLVLGPPGQAPRARSLPRAIPQHVEIVGDVTPGVGMRHVLEVRPRIRRSVTS